MESLDFLEDEGQERLLLAISNFGSGDTHWKFIEFKSAASLIFYLRNLRLSLESVFYLIAECADSSDSSLDLDNDFMVLSFKL